MPWSPRGVPDMYNFDCARNRTVEYFVRIAGDDAEEQRRNRGLLSSAWIV